MYKIIPNKLGIAFVVRVVAQSICPRNMVNLTVSVQYSNKLWFSQLMSFFNTKWKTSHIDHKTFHLSTNYFSKIWQINLFRLLSSFLMFNVKIVNIFSFEKAMLFSKVSYWPSIYTLCKKGVTSIIIWHCI